MSEPSMRSPLAAALVSTRPSTHVRHHSSKGTQSSHLSAVFLTSFVISLAISVSLSIPSAAAELAIVSESSEDTGQSAIPSQTLEVEEMIPVPTPSREGPGAGLVRDASGDGFPEVGSGDDDGDIVLSSREIKAIDLEIFKRQLLQKMGLDGRPPNNDHRSVLPAYLWDIYDNVVEGATLSSSSDFAHMHENENDDGRLFRTSDGRSYFDTVRTFFAAANPLWPTTLLFDIQRLPSNERWVEAELRVPWHNLLSDKLNVSKSGLEIILNETGLSRSIIQDDDASSVGNYSHEHEHRKHFIRINLYEVVNETVDIRHLIDTKLINVASSRHWTSFDVLSIVSRASTKLNVVKVAIEFVDCSSIDSHLGHSDRSRFLSALTENDQHLQSFDIEHSAALIMYGFDDDGKEKPIKYKNFYKYYMEHADDDDQQDRVVGTRRKRQAKNKRQRASAGRPRLRASESSNRHSSSGRRFGQQNQNLCQRRPLIIRFEDLNWQDWILAPQEYAAYYCSGQCSYPFADGQNTTNHAIVQALVNSVSPRTAPRPSCVPTETSSISMLYTDIDRNIVIKNYPDMIVEGCGCR